MKAQLSAWHLLEVTNVRCRSGRDSALLVDESPNALIRHIVRHNQRLNSYTGCNVVVRQDHPQCNAALWHVTLRAPVG